MRVLLIPSAIPKLYKCGDWLNVTQLVECNQDRSFFHVVAPGGSVPTGYYPNMKLYKSRDDSYYFFRDLAEMFSINDGKMIVDAVVVMSPYMAVGADIHLNSFSFGKLMWDVPITIWQPMFYAYTGFALKQMRTFYHNLFLGPDDHRKFQEFVGKTFRASVGEKILERTGMVPMGVHIKELHEKAHGFQKFSKPTVLFGARMNQYHSPDKVMRILRRFYEAGNEFQLILTTPDGDFPTEVREEGERLGAKMVPSCTRSMFHEYVCRSHVGLIAGTATAISFGAEYLSAGTIVVAEQSQWLELLQDTVGDYPYLWKTEEDAHAHLKSIWKDLDAAYKRFEEGKWYERIAHFDVGQTYRDQFDWIRGTVPAFKRRETGGIGGNRAKRFMSSLRMKGRCTLTELCEVAEESGAIIRDKIIGRWITRKMVHDLVVAHPAVMDTCETEEPEYVLDYDLDREWRERKEQEEGDEGAEAVQSE